MINLSLFITILTSFDKKLNFRERKLGAFITPLYLLLIPREAQLSNKDIAKPTYVNVKWALNEQN